MIAVIPWRLYSTVLLLHSWLRWVALVLGVVTTIAALVGRGSNSAPAADRLGLFFMIVLDVQLLLGLLLYFALSPVTAAAFKDFGAAMRDPALRFWAVEHAATMLLAVILAHVGNVLARKATDARVEAHAADRLLRPRHRGDDRPDAVARNAERPPALPRIIAAPIHAV